MVANVAVARSSAPSSTTNDPLASTSTSLDFVAHHHAQVLDLEVARLAVLVVGGAADDGQARPAVRQANGDVGDVRTARGARRATGVLPRHVDDRHRLVARHLERGPVAGDARDLPHHVSATSVPPPPPPPPPPPLVAIFDALDIPLFCFRLELWTRSKTVSAVFDRKQRNIFFTRRVAPTRKSLLGQLRVCVCVCVCVVWDSLS